MTVNGVNVITQGSFSEAEVQALVLQELDKIDPTIQDLVSLEITEVSDTEVDIQATVGGNVKRLRRITGYLSNIENFNKAKRAECTDRLIHGG